MFLMEYFKVDYLLPKKRGLFAAIFLWNNPLEVMCKIGMQVIAQKGKEFNFYIFVIAQAAIHLQSTTIRAWKGPTHSTRRTTPSGQRLPSPSLSRSPRIWWELNSKFWMVAWKTRNCNIWKHFNLAFYHLKSIWRCKWYVTELCGK